MGAAEVLVVDDDQDIRELVVQCLQDEGYTVYEASDGTPALERLRAHAGRLVVLLDVLMPQMGGFAVLQIVAENAPFLTRHAYIIIAATKKTPPPDVAALIEQLHVPYILKPFDLADLLIAVEEAANTLQ